MSTYGEILKQYEERIKKTALRANCSEELENQNGTASGLLPCQIVEEKEEFLFIYDIGERYALEKLHDEELLFKYLALIDIAGLQTLYENYEFSLSPENLYYDMNARVSVRSRDIYNDADRDRASEFVEKYKAVTGAILWEKYSYEDYIQGGLKLLKKKKLLSAVYDAETTEEIRERLLEEYLKTKQINRVKYRMVRRQSYALRTACACIFAACTVLLACAAGYGYFWVLPEKEAVIGANQSYYDADYIRVIDVLQEQKAGTMDVHTKCILAISYVRSENLTARQKENILALISPTGNEKYIDYWIMLGRGKVGEAENLAMQMSDDELLLYAYMKEKKQVEADDTIDGAEKSDRLTTLQKQIDELAEQYIEPEE